MHCICNLRDADRCGALEKAKLYPRSPRMALRTTCTSRAKFLSPATFVIKMMVAMFANVHNSCQCSSVASVS